MGADNPDNYYQNAQISGKYSYRIIGKRNTVDHISFFTQNGNYGSNGWTGALWEARERRVGAGADGSFEISVSKEPVGKNWLKMEDETTLLMVRQTFSDRFNEVACRAGSDQYHGGSKARGA